MAMHQYYREYGEGVSQVLVCLFNLPEYLQYRIILRLNRLTRSNATLIWSPISRIYHIHASLFLNMVIQNDTLKHVQQ